MVYEIYRERNFDDSSVVEWRWRLVKINGHIILSYSANSFRTKIECEENIHLVMNADFTTPVVEVYNQPSHDAIKSFARVFKSKLIQ